MEKKKLSEEDLNDVSGGSWNITEERGKRAGLSLRKEDGSAGSWGYLWNSGDYYWRGMKLTVHEAEAIDFFTYDTGRQPDSVSEAVQYYDEWQLGNRLGY